jgi:hypothetical protein
VVDDPALSSAFDPVLRGPVLVTGSETVTGSGQVGRVRFENLATGTTAGPVDLPAGDRMLDAGPDYVLTSHPEDTGMTSRSRRSTCSAPTAPSGPWTGAAAVQPAG